MRSSASAWESAWSYETAEANEYFCTEVRCLFTVSSGTRFPGGAVRGLRCLTRLQPRAHPNGADAKHAVAPELVENCLLHQLHLGLVATRR